MYDKNYMLKWLKWLGLGLAVGGLALTASVKTYIASLNRQNIMIAEINSKPDFNSDYATVGENNEWILKSFQPKVASFISENKSNYLIGEFKDIENRQRQVKIFISGQAPNSQIVENVLFEDSGGESAWLGFEELNQRLLAGEQVRVEYLGFKGKAYNRITCVEYPNFCALGSIAEKQQLGSELGERLVNGITDGLMVPAVTLSRQLYDK